MKKIFIFAVVILLAGCTSYTKEAYKRKLNTWMGSEPIDLVRSWGPPKQTYEVGGHQFLVYIKDYDFTIPASQPTYQTSFIGDKAYTTAIGGHDEITFNHHCETTFEVSENKIINWSFKGDDCVAEEE